jgi:Abortive infection alpha/Protein of unknown function (DUF2806)
MSDASGIINIAEKLVDFVHKLAGPLAEQGGLILGDNVKLYRLKNWVRITTEAQQILSDANLPPNAVPPRLFLPIREASSLEDNETLQSLWAGLLATASQQTDSVSPSFVETLKQLTPDEARHLQHTCNTLQQFRKQQTLANMSFSPYAFSEQWGAPPGVTSDTYERLGLIRRDFGMARGAGKPEVGYKFVLTWYAVRFLEACNGPRPSTEAAHSH